MALFNKEKKNSEIEEKKEEVKSSPKKTEKKSVKKEEIVFSSKNSEIAQNVLLEPWITEKTHGLIAQNKYVFKVTKTATKKKVKMAVEGIYGVSVEKVAMVKINDEAKYFGRRKGVKSGYKKAILSLKVGDSIKIFQGA